ncbi:DUF3363 domain-containing protein [Salmonella enterica subsp. enterica serovar Infantis]|nr:DUF3363 domain-containing protein [Salmonella enterica subsp. enterica serovar Infantis]
MGEKGVYSSYTCRVPGGDYEGYVDAHVRRLEALRRAGIVERIDADQWRIPDDLVSRAAAHDAGRDSQASVRVLSPVDLNKQIGSDGATWLDRRLIHGETADLAPTGFGQQVREAMDQRREHHIGHCCKVSDEAAFCLIQRPYISKTLLTRRISPRGSP